MGIVEDKAAKKTAKSGLALAPGIEPRDATNEDEAATEAHRDAKRDPEITQDEEAVVVDPSLPPEAVGAPTLNDVTPLEA